MTTAMAPPPPRNPTTATAAETPTPTSPPLPPPATTAPSPITENPNPLPTTPDSDPVDESDAAAEKEVPEERRHGSVAPPYAIPLWSGPPCHRYSLEVLKGGLIVDQFDVHEKGAYMFGRVDLCDFVLEHPTISRFHAVLQFKKNGDAYLYDLNSTHGTSINKKQVNKKEYVELHVGDVIRFGQSSRLYIFQGPTELMLPEGDLKKIRSAKMREQMYDMEASLLRAKREANLANGISWGMDEDAIEELEDDNEEITWQTYTGQLTERQEKTREKVLKRLEKIANMKKEIDAIRAKDIAQGGLTQGQQTQIARNEQRMAQIAEELENLEETLNESIRESLGARTGRTSRGKNKAAADDEDDYMSDDDEFYDRTKKRTSKTKDEKQSIETADSLLAKKDVITKEIEEKRKLLSEEKEKSISQQESVSEAGDALDAFMTGLSSQLVHDEAEKLQKELESRQSELDRVIYLLKIADPTGEAAKRRESTSNESKPKFPEVPPSKSSVEPSRRREAAEAVSVAKEEQCTSEVTTKPRASQEETVIVTGATDEKSAVYTVNKPQWLGAVENRLTEKSKEVPLISQESDQFVDYKDRKEILGKSPTPEVDLDTSLENAAPGLIIRKRKQAEKSDVSKVNDSEQSSSLGNEIKAQDAVALLLKHSQGYRASDDEEIRGNGVANGSLADSKKKPKKVLGPERPSFLDGEMDYESWVPPQGQSGDGRTSLNDRYGY